MADALPAGACDGDGDDGGGDFGGFVGFDVLNGGAAVGFGGAECDSESE